MSLEKKVRHKFNKNNHLNVAVMVPEVKFPPLLGLTMTDELSPLKVAFATHS
jgi:hypothetical protein